MAEYFAVEAGVFLPSATMAGQIAIRVWSRPGDLVLIEEFGHNYYFETGFMAAAALYGFHHDLQRLAQDHDHCLAMAQRLAGHPDLEIDLASVQTNIFYCRVKAGPERAAGLVEQLAAQGIGARAIGSRLRLVTGLNVSREDCAYAAEEIVREIFNTVERSRLPPQAGAGKRDSFIGVLNSARP